MTRIRLRISTQPSQAEVFVNLRQQGGGYFTYVMLVDTGAQVSLLPKD